MVGIAQSRVSDLGKNISIIDSDNTYIPDLRYKIDQEDEKKIFEKYQQGLVYNVGENKGRFLFQ